MAINFRASSNATNTSNPGPLVIPKPTGTTAGDTLVLHIMTDADPTVLPEGFILVPGSTITGAFPIRVYMKLAGPNEPTNYLLYFSTGTVSCGLTALYADSGNPLEVDVIANQTNASSTNRTFPSVVTTVANDFLMYMAILNANQASTPDAACTERYDYSATGRPYLMTETVAGIGATTVRVATGTATSSKVVTMALKEATGHTGTIRSTQEGAYIELVPDPQIAVTQSGLYAELQPDPQIVVSQYGLYVELELGGEPTNEEYVTELPVFAELTGEGVELTELPVYAEFAAVGVTLTELPVYAEFGAEGITLTEMPVFIEFEYKATGGMIIIGEYKTWHDHYPKNVTDITLFQAYNFMITANGMYMIDLEWEDVEDEDGYEIERSLDGLGGWTLMHVTDPNVTKYVSIMLTPDTTYYYRIRSFNEGGYSAYSPVVSETTRKIGPSLIGKSGMANIKNANIIIEKPPNVQIGDYMLMQIGIEDTDKIVYPAGWVLEDTIPGIYTNLIFSRTALIGEPDYYTIQRVGAETPIVTISIFAWDGANDNIIYYDG